MQLKICNGIKAQEGLYQDQAKPEIFFLIPDGMGTITVFYWFYQYYIEDGTRVDPSMGVYCVSHQKTDSQL